MSLRALALVALLLGASTSTSAQASASVGRRLAPGAAHAAARTILFVGNSFTFGDAAGGPELVRPFGAGTVTDLNGDGIGGVPALFKRFATEAGLEYDVSLETRSGAGLDYHYDNKLALINRRWDVVVLQGYSTLDPARPGDPTRLIRYSSLLVDSLCARNPKVEVHLLATWSRADQTYLPAGHWYGHSIEAMARRVQAGYEAARARSPQVKEVVRVGAAWTRAIHAGFADGNPYDGIDAGKVDLWAPDGYHASVYGYYLEALMTFGTITGLDPRSLGATESAAREIGIMPSQAAALQAIASQELVARR